MRLIDADILKQQDFQDFSNTDVFNAIDSCPTVVPKDLRPKGKWISKGRKLECSVCYHRVYLGTDDEDLHKFEKSIRKYCSWCGAEMEDLK